jgi:hypothetical protein
MTKADTTALAAGLGITGTISSTMRIALAQAVATQALATAVETLLAQNVEDGPRIDKSLALTAVALKVA